MNGRGYHLKKRKTKMSRRKKFTKLRVTQAEWIHILIDSLQCLWQESHVPGIRCVIFFPPQVAGDRQRKNQEKWSQE